MDTLEIDNRRRPRNPRMRLSQCFPSALMCSETTAIYVCPKRVSKACREAFVTIKTSLGKSICFAWSGSTREAKMSSEKQSETCSLVLVTLGVCRPVSGCRLLVRGSGVLGAPSRRRLQMFGRAPV
ncbi:hypothetical protein CRG98_017855 [Punica granatum]|uniref:Uncharacterized protein n=1 Tax=Punica granatum TaxID=22663 RepID=A0A2I0K0Y9_PUNGR|nr:hypothetical protein CRG98_017855 [Punica granatum]